MQVDCAGVPNVLLVLTIDIQRSTGVKTQLDEQAKLVPRLMLNPGQVSTLMRSGLLGCWETRMCRANGGRQQSRWISSVVPTVKPAKLNFQTAFACPTAAGCT